MAFSVKVHPHARKNAITGELDGALKVSLTSPPIDGKANEACIMFFVKLLKVPRSSVTIASGQSNRRKVIRVSGLSAEEVRERIAIQKVSIARPFDSKTHAGSKPATIRSTRERS